MRGFFRDCAGLSPSRVPPLPHPTRPSPPPSPQYPPAEFAKECCLSRGPRVCSRHAVLYQQQGVCPHPSKMRSHPSPWVILTSPPSFVPPRNPSPPVTTVGEKRRRGGRGRRRGERRERGGEGGKKRKIWPYVLLFLFGLPRALSFSSPPGAPRPAPVLFLSGVGRGRGEEGGEGRG